MENSMQPLARSEQDKTVPIDTSGEPVDIELKDEENKEEVVQGKEEATESDNKQEEVKDEAEEYSANVKKKNR